MRDLSKPGHLLVFSKEGRNYFLYLYIMKPDMPFAALTVLEGIRELAKERKLKVDIRAFSEFKRVASEFPDQKEIINIPLEILVDGKEKFKKDLFITCLENLLAGYASVFPERVIGAVARENSFVRFEENSRRIIEGYILRGKNVVIDAPRRAGKTSLLFRLASEERLKAYRILYLDMERASDPLRFAAILIAALETRTGDTALKRAAKELGLSRKLEKDYKTKVEAQLKRISSKEKLLLAFDECSFMLEEMLKKGNESEYESNKQKAIDFLSWFKKLRKNHANIRFLFSGSIKFAVFENELDKDGFFSDCKEYSLKPMDEASAKNLVEGLFYSEEIYPPDHVTDHIIKRTTPCFPYFLQIVTDEMVKYHRARRKFPTQKEMEGIIENEIIGTNCRRYMDQFLVNLRRYSPLEEKGARVLLNRLSNVKEEKKDKLKALYVKATGDEKGFPKVLALIEYDFYITERNGHYSFANELMKNWWKTNFALSGD